MRKSSGLIVAFALSSLCAAASIAEPTTQPVEDAIAHLGDPDPAVREHAMQTLQAAGAEARAALRAAAEGDDPEIAARAQAALRAGPTTVASKPVEADDTLPQILRYRTSEPDGKREIISELSSTPNGLRSLTRIWLIETDPELRSAIFDELIADTAVAASTMLADGNDATAERLLQAAVDRKTGESPQSYAAYWLSRGKVDEAIRKWSARGGQTPADVWAEQVLTALYRAKGDYKSALVHARLADDEDLFQATLLWAGEWSELAKELRRNPAPRQEPRSMALLCGAEAMAGDNKELDADVARLIALATTPDQATAASDILLLISRPDDAVKVMLGAKQYYGAYEIQVERGRFDQAAALLGAHDTEKDENALLLRASAAKAFARFGQKKQLEEMSARLEKENAVTKSARAFCALAEAERDGGMTEKSWEHFLSSIELAGDNNPQWYVMRAFPEQGNDVNWSGIWTAAITKDPQRVVKELFARVRSCYERTLPLDDLITAVSSVDLNDESYHAYVELIWETHRRLLAAGRGADAGKMIEERATASPDGELYVHLGDAASEKKDWAGAVKYYGQAWKKDRTQALPLYLLGWATERGGQKVEGRQKMALAHMLPVGDEVRRAAFISGLIARGFDDAAAREADVLIRTGNPLSTKSQEAMRAGAALADDRRDYAVATALWQRASAEYLSGAYWFSSHAEYLHMPNAIRDSDARARVLAGDFDAARHQIGVCLDILPIDSSIVIDVVPELDKAGKHAEADALFAKMFAVQESLCRKYPDSAFQLNECAWLAAKCHRELDKAVTLAQHAADLKPNAVDILDTLAEAHFEHGDLEKAVAEEARCVDLSPNIPFHRKQLAVYRAARDGAKK